ncbi:hypothetical protein ABZ352_35620 [Streptomyces griseofuscus]|uniref:hypothetical protein n=1 Tax=Streptomyces griseofuscus TaxID=146922 RepID=UPI0033EC30F5
MADVSITNEQIRAAQGGDQDAMWEIVSSFDGMLKGIINTLAPRATYEQREDHLQDGRAVLLQMIHDYDSTVDVDSVTGRFIAYVHRALRRTIAEADVSASTVLSIDSTGALRVKRALWDAGGDVDKAWESFRDAESATKRMSREAFIAMVAALDPTESLDAPIGGDDSEALTLSDIIADPEDDAATTTERRDYARWLMTQIPQRQSFALRAYYGVNMTALPDAEAASKLQVATSRLRRLRFDGCASARKVTAQMTTSQNTAVLSQAA